MQFIKTEEPVLNKTKKSTEEECVVNLSAVISRDKLSLVFVLFAWLGNMKTVGFP